MQKCKQFCKMLLFLQKHWNKMSHQPSLYSRLLTWDNKTTVDMGTGEEPSIYSLLQNNGSVLNLWTKLLPFRLIPYKVSWYPYLEMWFSYWVIFLRDCQWTRQSIRVNFGVAESTIRKKKTDPNDLLRTVFGVVLVKVFILPTIKTVPFTT